MVNFRERAWQDTRYKDQENQKTRYEDTRDQDASGSQNRMPLRLQDPRLQDEERQRDLNCRKEAKCKIACAFQFDLVLRPGVRIDHHFPRSEAETQRHQQ